MTGVIEDDDPGRGASGLFTVGHIVAAPPEDSRPALDVELFEDRLRLMGIDRDLVEEAGRRLRVDPQAGVIWVAEQLQRREPPRKPPNCDTCGEELVEAEWRGRATVRCQRCGSRWGVEVGDDHESMWALSGPSLA